MDVVSMAGEWLTATANTNMFTYEIAPVFILMENEVLGKMREIIGFQTGDSILAPGKHFRKSVGPSDSELDLQSWAFSVGPSVLGLHC